MDKITDDTTFTTYIIDISGRIYTGAPSKVDFADVNNGFFGKIISFFKGLFNLLPTVVFGK